jgi:hypothetical protein
LLLHKKELGLVKCLHLEIPTNGSSTTVPSISKTQTINKCNKHVCYECKSERGSDSNNFGARITEFGVVVGKI